MARGKTISLFLPDSDPKGIKFCEVTDRIVKGISIPRSQINKLNEINELNAQGIYFLIGDKSQSDKPTIYIGEAEVLTKRIRDHNLKRDFWNSVICFISEKNNINKAHIKYLENHAFNEALRINKCFLENTTIPSKSNLTRQEEDFALSFFDDLKLIMATLGFPIFEESKKNKSNIFYCKSKDADAKGEYVEDGFTVFKDSKANLEESKSSGTWVKGMRKDLLDKKILQVMDNILLFTEDFTFSSPSAAAAVVLARRANGWTEWRDKQGKTMDEKIRK